MTAAINQLVLNDVEPCTPRHPPLLNQEVFHPHGPLGRTGRNWAGTIEATMETTADIRGGPTIGHRRGENNRPCYPLSVGDLGRISLLPQGLLGCIVIFCIALALGPCNLHRVGNKNIINNTECIPLPRPSFPL